MNKKDYYDILGVSKTATQDEIKSAFRKKAKTCHPDVNKSKEAEAEFKELGEAYSVLGDAEKRKQYDQFGSAAFDGSAGGGFNGFNGGGFQGFSGFDDIDLGDIFSDMFGSSFFGGRGSKRKTKTKGKDMIIKMNLTFSEAVYGCEKEVSLNMDTKCDKCDGVGGTSKETCKTCGGRGRVISEQRSMFGTFQTETVCPKCNGSGSTFKDECPKCHGTGHYVKDHTIIVTVPEGVDTGHQLRLSGKGPAGSNGGPNGDIYIEFNVSSHPLFEREDNDIYLSLPLTITEAVLGCKKEIPTLYGTLIIDIDPSTQNGEKLRIKGKGVTDPNSGKKGDMYVITDIIIPTKLDRKQKDLFKELDNTTLDNEKEFKNFKKYC